VQNRLRVVKFFALHRKLGWHVYLITQSEKRLDNQVRDNFEFHTRLKNMHKFRVWGLFPVVPFNWFWAITCWHASGGERVGIQSYLLNKLADCYDTMARPEVPRGGRELDVIQLPLSASERSARSQGLWSPGYVVQAGRADGRTAAAEPRRTDARTAVPESAEGLARLPPGELPLPSVNDESPAGAGTAGPSGGVGLDA
jgi:hypothetical protein